MYKSADGGKTWTHIGLADSQQIGARAGRSAQSGPRLRRGPRATPTARTPSAASSARATAARRWQKVLVQGRRHRRHRPRLRAGQPERDLRRALADAPHALEHLSAVERPGQRPLQVDRRRRHWTQLTATACRRSRGASASPWRRAQPQRVYAIVDAAEEGGLYRSDDGGATWTHASGDNRIWGRGWYFGGVTVEPKNADVVYALQHQPLPLGRRRQDLRAGQGRAGRRRLPRALDRSAEPGAAASSASTRATVVSVNGGETWSSWYNQPTGQFYHVITDNRFPYWVYGSQQDSGAAGVPSRTNTLRRHQHDGVPRDHRRRRERQHRARSEGPRHRSTAAASTSSTCAPSQTRSVDPTLAYPDALPRAPGRCRSSSRRAIRACSTSRNQRLFRTDDGGEHWTVDQPRPDARGPRRARRTSIRPPRRYKPRPGSRFGVIYAIAPSRTADHDLWVGTDDGLIWRTRDEGAHWTNVTPPALTPWSKVGIIDDLALRRRDRLRGRRPPPPRRLQALHLPHARRRQAAGSWSPTGIPRRQLRQRRARGPGAQGAALRRHGEGRLRLVRRRRPLAAAAARTCR